MVHITRNLVYKHCWLMNSNRQRNGHTPIDYAQEACIKNIKVHSKAATPTSSMGGEELSGKDLEGITESSASSPQAPKWLAKKPWESRGSPSEIGTAMTATTDGQEGHIRAFMESPQK